MTPVILDSVLSVSYDLASVRFIRQWYCSSCQSKQASFGFLTGIK